MQKCVKGMEDLVFAILFMSLTSQIEKGFPTAFYTKYFGFKSKLKNLVFKI